MTCKYGIDFGTTNSSIAVRYIDEDGNERTIIANTGEKPPYEIIPSVLCIAETGEICVAGRSKQSEFEKNGIKAVVVKKIKMKLEEDPDNFEFKVGEKIFNGVDLLASLFRYLREKAEENFNDMFGDGVNISGVVMGVPVSFGDKQKKILMEALYEAGFYNSKEEAYEQTEFVSEPVAVAVHYGLTCDDDKTVMIFDFGGGTLDIAIINLKNQVENDYLHPHEVKGKDRITLGGTDLTKKIFSKIFCSSKGYGKSEIQKEFGIDGNLTEEELYEELGRTADGTEFIEEIDQIKCDLLSINKTSDTYSPHGRGVFFSPKRFFQNDFVEAIKDERNEINKLVDKVLRDSGIDDINEIDEVIIAGGSSLIICVQEQLKSKFGLTKVKTSPGDNPDSSKEVLTSIVRGLAAVGIRKNIEDVTDSSYGVWDDVDNCFRPIINSGMKMEEVSKFDKIFGTGISEDFKVADESQRSARIKVYQNALGKDAQLGTINIDDVGGKKFRIFMHIDPDRNMLIVDVYDRIKKIWIPVNNKEREFNISIKGDITNGQL